MGTISSFAHIQTKKKKREGESYYYDQSRNGHPIMAIAAIHRTEPGGHGLEILPPSKIMA
jgi:hypothetical protein